MSAVQTAPDLTTADLHSGPGFRLPDERIARAPAEARGMSRDGVALMVTTPHGLTHHRFRDLPGLLRADDVLAVNTSAVIPAAVPARLGGQVLRLHLSTRLPGGWWLTEPRTPTGHGSSPHEVEAPAGLTLPAGGEAHLLAPYPAGGAQRRLWLTELSLSAPVHAWLDRHGQPIRYGRPERAWPLEAYQTVFATRPGSAESPSAARGFTPALVTRLVAAGIELVPVVLHTGVSSHEAGEAPYPEWFEVSTASARRLRQARGSGRRIIAVGTTVARALESGVDDRGEIQPARGLTELVITPKRGVRGFDGLLTGWHEPESSHLRLLRAVGGTPLVDASYQEALAGDYLWHEFGDLHLLLP